MKLQKPTTMLFDWDNTLVNTWPIIHQALHDTFCEYDMTPWTLEDVKERVGRSMRDAFPELFGEAWEAAGERYLTHYRRYHLEKLEPLEGARALLEALVAKHIPLAVVSNKRNVSLREEISHLGWPHYFASVVGAHDAEHDKPHPAPVLMALEQMKLRPGNSIWFVGDTATDLECAKLAGVVSVFYGDRLTESDGNGGLLHKGWPVHAHVRDFKALHALLSQYDAV